MRASKCLENCSVRMSKEINPSSSVTFEESVLEREQIQFPKGVDKLEINRVSKDLPLLRKRNSTSMTYDQDDFVNFGDRSVK